MKHNRVAKIAATVVVATAALIGVHTILTPHHIAPDALYPTSSLSPGLVATESFADLTAVNPCGTYSQCHRQTTAAQKSQVRAEYPKCPSQQEIDHIVPLAIGGADDVKNLWCQPLVNTWNGKDFGYKTKDALENYLVLQVKNKEMTPQAAQECILMDWVKCYQTYFTPAFGSTNTICRQNDAKSVDCILFPYADGDDDEVQ